MRRKIGVMTLLVGCIFAAGWIRSYAVIDEIEILVSQMYTIGSTSGSLECFQWNGRERRASGMLGSQPRLWHSMPNYLPISSQYAPTLPHRISAEIDYGPDLRLLETEGRYGPNRIAAGTGIRIAYRSLVIPLTLLSAWLLLSNTRKLKEKTVDELSAVART